MSAQSSFYIKPAEYEQIETVVHIKQETRPGLIGSVTETESVPAQDAFVALFEVLEENKDRLVATAYTDRDGRFIFGPLEAGRLYLVRISKNSEKLRQIEQNV
ncbi:MAG: carboxypeptidase-like regulatory domain-containing protein [Bacillota bacterium]|nr:carboxypeptidase-like regulatory domain-containing protein [Bacillota bacterium]